MTMLRVCSAPGCTRLIKPQAKHCQTHARIDNAKRRSRTIKDGRHRTAWIKTRAAVLARDNHTCTQCGGYGTGVHKVGNGYHTTDPADYVTLCPSCHGRLHRAQQLMGGVDRGSRDAHPPKPPTSFPREKPADASKNENENGLVRPFVA